MTDLAALADRIEREGPSVGLLIDAWQAIHGPKPPRVQGGSDELTQWLHRFDPFYAKLRAEAWLSAAEMLVPEGCWWNAGQDTDFGWANVTPWGTDKTVEALNCPTPAAALAAAAIRARMSDD